MALPDLIAPLIVVPSAANTVSESVTIPAGTELLLILAGGYSPPTGITDMSVGGSAATIHANTMSSGGQHIWIASLLSPPTGSQTFAVSHGNVVNEGVVYYLLPLQNVADTDPVVGFGVSGATTDPVSAAFVVTDNSRVWVVSCSYQSPLTTAVAGQTQIANSGLFNSDYVSIGVKDGVSPSTTVAASATGGDAFYTVVGGIAIEGTESGGSPVSVTAGAPAAIVVAGTQINVAPGAAAVSAGPAAFLIATGQELEVMPGAATIEAGSAAAIVIAGAPADVAPGAAVVQAGPGAAIVAGGAPAAAVSGAVNLQAGPAAFLISTGQPASITPGAAAIQAGSAAAIVVGGAPAAALSGATNLQAGPAALLITVGQAASVAPAAATIEAGSAAAIVTGGAPAEATAGAINLQAGSAVFLFSSGHSAEVSPGEAILQAGSAAMMLSGGGVATARIITGAIVLAGAAAAMISFMPDVELRVWQTTPAERTFNVPPEQREFSVPAEIREFNVPAEIREFTVPSN